MDSISTIVDSVKLDTTTVSQAIDTIVDTVKAVADSVVSTAVHGASAPSAEAHISFFKDASIHMPMLFFIIGGLAIFLLGMNHMSSGLQTIAGPKLRSLVASVTNNRIMAATVGVAVTTIVQSSSVTTVMVVGFVNSGIMTLTQALGVIFGANIGTTITGWIVALKVGKYGLPILAIAAFFYLFSKKDRVKYAAMAIMGVGMVFFGLQLMKYGFKPIAKDPAFASFFAMFTADSYFGVLKCVLAGALLTSIVQSSSATLVITMTLATTGAIPFTTAAALVLGENIGTTITAFLASLNTNSAAKRAAYGHILFNVFGVLWITAIFQQYIHLIDFLFIKFQSPLTAIFGKGHGGTGNVAVEIAMVHTGFNVVNTVLFIPLIGYMAKLLYKIVPEKDYKEGNHLTALSANTMHESSVISIEESKVEIDKMADITKDMSDLLYNMLEEDKYSEKDIKRVFVLEEKLDTYQKEVSQFLMALLATKSLSHDMVTSIQRQFRFADEYESVSDYFASILKRMLRLKNEKMELSELDIADILELHGKLSSYLERVNKTVKLCSFGENAKLIVEAGGVKATFKDKRHQHLTRLQGQTVEPLISVSYMDILTNYRKINDHLINIADVAI